jgi:hypothetical protein
MEVCKFPELTWGMDGIGEEESLFQFQILELAECHSFGTDSIFHRELWFHVGKG